MAHGRTVAAGESGSLSRWPCNLGTWLPICLRAIYPVLQREPMLPMAHIAFDRKSKLTGRDHCIPRGISVAKCAVAVTATTASSSSPSSLSSLSPSLSSSFRQQRHRDRHRTIFPPCKKSAARAASVSDAIFAPRCAARRTYVRTYRTRTHRRY